MFPACDHILINYTTPLLISVISKLWQKSGLVGNNNSTARRGLVNSQQAIVTKLKCNCITVSRTVVRLKETWIVHDRKRSRRPKRIQWSCYQCKANKVR